MIDYNLMIAMLIIITRCFASVYFNLNQPRGKNDGNDNGNLQQH